MSDKIVMTKSEKLERLILLKDQTAKANKHATGEAASYYKEVSNHLQYLKEGDIGYSQRIARGGWSSHYYYVRFKEASKTAERREKRLQKLITRLQRDRKKPAKPSLPLVALTPDSTNGSRLLDWMDDYGVLNSRRNLKISLADLAAQHGYVEHIMTYFQTIVNNDKRVTEKIASHVVSWMEGALINPPPDLAILFGIAMVPEPAMPQFVGMIHDEPEEAIEEYEGEYNDDEDNDENEEDDP